MGELTLRQLEYFVAVVDAGSVTAASKKVNVTQATVSMAIAQLESRLGTDLLIRQQSKGVVPTRAGRELSARARHVVAMTAEIEQVAATGTSEISGVLEIGCVSSLSPQVVPPLAAHFARHYPQVTFNYREGSAGDLQQVLIDGALDMAFVFSRQTLEAVHSHDITEAILKIMLPAKHPLGSKKSISFSEVAHESAILIDLPPSRDRSIEFMRNAGVDPQQLHSPHVYPSFSAEPHGNSWKLHEPPKRRVPLILGAERHPTETPVISDSTSIQCGFESHWGDH
jgi:DNA-binding transcriptional LysR family regulator